MEQAGQAKSLTGQVLINDLATALDGHGGIKSITLNDDYTLTFIMSDDTEVQTTSVRGATGAKGDKGTDGRAITSVAKISTSGLVDTYKISFSDSTSTNFTVTNGSSIKSIAKTGTSGLTDTYTVTLTDETTSTFNVKNGNGISSITLQSGTHAAGTTDTYKITFDNGEFTTFSVYNGMNGSGSVVSVNGQSPDVNGNVSLTGENIHMSASDDTTIPGAIAAKQTATNDLVAEATLAEGDYFPFYDVSATANRKTPLSNILSKIRAAFASTPLAVNSGGTGATTAAAARSNLGITPENIGALPLTGGTVSGKINNTYTDGTGIGIEISHTNAEKDCGIDIRKESSDKSGAMFIGVGGSGKTGIYSYALNKWILYAEGTSVNIDGQQYRHIYVGTAAPSGGSDGDVYIRYS